ncbi:MAG: response regulator transcription factor [Bacteroidetes bacterium]|nr:response regulator transcription factor [Bacteroidota bacterium]
MVTVGIIEDNQALRTGIEEFISQNNDMRVVFSCNSVEKWLVHYNQDIESPYVLFLDIGLPGISGLKAISVIKDKYPETKLVVITGDASRESIWEAITTGADGYLLKPFSLKEISQQIEILQNGGAVISPVVAEKLIHRINAQTRPAREGKNLLLTRRENDVLEQLVKGLSYKEVAHILQISFATVNDHIKNIYFKTGVNSKSELIAKVLSSRQADGRLN